MSFNPDEFLNESNEGGLDTRIIPFPAGEYIAVLSEVSKPAQTDKGQTYIKLKLDLQLTEEAVQVTGRDKGSVNHTLWLDLTPQGRLDRSKAKNVGLGRVLAACNLNTDGKSWTWNDLVGKMVKVKVTQRPDKNDSETVYNDVGGVTAV